MYVTKRKRVVKLPDREINFGDWKLTDFIVPECLATHEVFAKAWGRLSDFYRMYPNYAITLEKYIGFHNMLIKEMWNVVNLEIKYRHDDPIFQTPDFWLLPNEAWTQKHGDCEDTTFLLVSAIEGFLESIKVNNKIYACIGFYIDPYKNVAYGHAFPIYKAEFYKDWLWLESTLESAVSQSTWYVWTPQYLIPVYFFNKREAHRIDRDYELLGLDEKYVEAHRDLIYEMIDYVEFGRWSKVKWMHKGRRVPVLLSTLVVPVA